MGIENILLCSIFFDDPLDLPMFGNGEEIKRAEIYKKVNDVGTSDYQSFLSDPQPAPAVEIKTPDLFVMGSVAKPIIKDNSINYINQDNELLGGVTNLNPAELRALIIKYSKGK